MPERANMYFRDLPSRVFSEDARMPPRFLQFFGKRIWPRLRLDRGYKIDRKRDIAARAVRALIAAGLADGTVADGRDTGQAGVEMRVTCWNAIIAAGYARACLGSETSGKQTRYRATRKLLSLKREWELELLEETRLERNTEMSAPTRHALVVIQTGKVDPATGRPLPADLRRQPLSIAEHVRQRAQRGAGGGPDPRAVRNGIAYWREVEDQIESINRANLTHSWQAFRTDPDTGRKFVFQPNPCVRQVHCGDSFRAARLYSWGELSGQSLPKETRQGMLIDGEEVAELDFRGMAFMLAYHLKARFDPPWGDVYRPRKVMPKFYRFGNASKRRRQIVRNFVKLASNICLNVSSRPNAEGAVWKLLKENPDSEFLERVVFNVEGVKPADIVTRIVRAHRRLRQVFFTEAGVDLMTVDGRIMKRILLRFVVESGRPALPIHDSIVCRRRDAALATKVMAGAYRAVALHEPAIRRVY